MYCNQWWWNIVVGFCCCVSCSSNNTSVAKKEVLQKAKVILADETFKPIIEQQKKVFESQFANSKLTIHYKPESECIKALASDSVDLCIVGRKLTLKEEQYYLQTIKQIPGSRQIARDGLAVITSINNPLKTVSLKQLQQYATVKRSNTSGYKLIFDGLKATSTVRIFADSLLKGNIPVETIEGKENSEALLQYVMSDNSAMGLIGWCWVGNYQNAEQDAIRKKVKVLPIVDDINFKDSIIMPSQYAFYYIEYPLVRGVYAINKAEPFTSVKMFLSFMSNEQGQLVFRRANMAPSIISFEERSLNVN
jgi:phosphate transport system substrate-binding protein